LTSKEIQKKLVKDKKLVSGIYSIYDDDDEEEEDENEICDIVDCELIRKLQPIGRPTSKVINYDHYSNAFRNYFYEFLYGNSTASDSLQKIYDITKIHYISLYDKEQLKETSIGRSIFVLLITIIVILLSLYIFPFIKRSKYYFNFLSKDLWMITIIGSIIIIFSAFTEIGPKKDYKCQLKAIFVIVGLTLVFSPILYKLIINFPEENDISNWIERHKYHFLIITLIPDILFYCLFTLNSFTIEEKIIDNGKYFEKCSLTNKLVIFSLTVLLIIKFIVMIIMLALIYIEWNIEATFDDVHLLSIHILVDFIYIFIIFVVSFINFKNYIHYFIVNVVVIVVFSLINYMFLFGMRIVWILMRKKYNHIEFIKNVNRNFIDEKDLISAKYLGGGSIRSKRKHIIKYNTNTSSIDTGDMYSTIFGRSLRQIEKGSRTFNSNNSIGFNEVSNKKYIATNNYSNTNISLGSNKYLNNNNGLGSNKYLNSNNGLGSNKYLNSNNGLGSNKNLNSNNGLGSNKNLNSNNGLGSNKYLNTSNDLGSNKGLNSTNGLGSNKCLSNNKDLNSSRALNNSGILKNNEAMEQAKEDNGQIRPIDSNDQNMGIDSNDEISESNEEVDENIRKLKKNKNIPALFFKMYTYHHKKTRITNKSSLNNSFASSSIV